MTQLIRFLVSHGASAFATGVHVVLLAWVSLEALHLSAIQWAVVQAAALIPNLLLMLVAGAWADRYDPAKVLTGAQAVLTAAYIVLFATLSAELGSFVSLVGYAIVIGAATAFLQPVREKYVSELPVVSLQKRVSLVSMTQFALQGAGIGLAALSDAVGIVWVIGVQAGVSLVATVVFASLIRGSTGAQNVSTSGEIASALRTVWRNLGLRQLMALIAFNGYMHMGVFLVLIPIVATRVYGFSAPQYAGLQALFVLGMVISHAFLLKQRTVEYPGQGALFSLLYTAMIGFGLAKSPTEIGFYTLVFAWGLVAGNSASRCRIVAQSLTASDMRGRVMSVYQLMLFGFAPVGALVTGGVLKWFTHTQIFYVMSGSSIALFAVFMLTRTLWGVQQVESEPVEPQQVGTEEQSLVDDTSKRN